MNADFRLRGEASTPSAVEEVEIKNTFVFKNSIKKGKTTDGRSAEVGELCKIFQKAYKAQKKGKLDEAKEVYEELLGKIGSNEVVEHNLKLIPTKKK